MAYSSATNLYGNFEGRFVRLSQFRAGTSAAEAAARLAESDTKQLFLVVGTSWNIVGKLLERMGLQSPLEIQTYPAPLHEPTLALAGGRTLSQLWQNGFQELRRQSASLRFGSSDVPRSVQFESSSSSHFAYQMRINVRNITDALSVASHLKSTLASLEVRDLDAGYRFDEQNQPIILLGDKAYNNWHVEMRLATAESQAAKELSLVVNFVGDDASDSVISQNLLVGLERSGKLISTPDSTQRNSLAQTALGMFRSITQRGGTALSPSEDRLATALGLFLSHGIGRYFILGQEGHRYLQETLKMASMQSYEQKPINQVMLNGLRELAQAQNQGLDLSAILARSGFQSAILSVVQAARRLHGDGSDSQSFVQEFLNALLQSSFLTDLPQAHNSPYFEGAVQTDLGTTYVLPVQLTRYNAQIHGSRIADGYSDREPEGYARAPFLRYSSDLRYRSISQLRGPVINRRAVYRTYVNGQIYELRGTIFSQYAADWNSGVIIRGEDGKHYAIQGPLTSGQPRLHIWNNGDILREND